MKLATLHDGSRDGQLVVVSRDLTSAHLASHIAGTLQRVLDDWNFLSPQLEDLSATLNGGKARHAFPFDPARCMAPLPRAYQRLMVIDGATGSATSEPSTGAAAQPVLQRLASDSLLSPRGPLPADGMRCLPGLAAITGDLPAGTGAEAALEGVRLLLLCADWRGPGGDWLACSCAPVAMTPDELGAAWRGGRLRGQLLLQAWAGQAERAAGRRRLVHPCAMPAGFGALLAQACSHRSLVAGSLVGCHLLSPVGVSEAAAEPGEAAAGSGEAAAAGMAAPAVSIALLDADEHEVFGSIAPRRAAAAPDAA